MSNVGVVVERRQYESIDSLLYRFRQSVEKDGILKDFRLNTMMSREERRRFKKFANDRRMQKKLKRVDDITNSSGGLKSGEV
jgi:ribosomal protein S21